MHNEEYFPEPFKFRPERWLGPEDGTSGGVEEEQARAAMRAAFAPFAPGDTGCLGKAIAYHETSLVLAKTLWYFDFEKASGEAGKLGEGRPGRTDGRDKVDEYQLFDLAVADHDGPNLLFIARGEYWKELNGQQAGLSQPMERNFLMATKLAANVVFFELQFGVLRRIQHETTNLF
jgi:hypothetical protein